jgi:hypothetical protein
MKTLLRSAASARACPRPSTPRRARRSQCVTAGRVKPPAAALLHGHAVELHGNRCVDAYVLNSPRGYPGYPFKVFRLWRDVRADRKRARRVDAATCSAAADHHLLPHASFMVNFARPRTAVNAEAEYFLVHADFGDAGADWASRAPAVLAALARRRRGRGMAFRGGEQDRRATPAREDPRCASGRAARRTGVARSSRTPACSYADRAASPDRGRPTGSYWQSG